MLDASSALNYMFKRLQSIENLASSTMFPYTAFSLSHYANGFSHSPYGNSCIEAKPQPEITPNGSFDEKVPSHYAIDGNGSFG